MGDFSGNLEPLSDDEKRELKDAEREFFNKDKTWRDLEHLLGKNPICTRDEGGVGMFPEIKKDGGVDYHYDDTLITKNTNAIVAFWVQGGSEGYYVHVRPVLSSEGKRFDRFGAPEMVGKFWGIDTAEACANYIMRITNDLI